MLSRRCVPWFTGGASHPLRSNRICTSPLLRGLLEGILPLLSALNRARRGTVLASGSPNGFRVHWMASGKCTAPPVVYAIAGRDVRLSRGACENSSSPRVRGRARRGHASIFRSSNPSKRNRYRRRRFALDDTGARCRRCERRLDDRPADSLRDSRSRSGLCADATTGKTLRLDHLRRPRTRDADRSVRAALSR